MNSLISPDAAKGRIRANLHSGPAISYPLEKCAGRILRQAVRADRPFPPFDRSMMDGYALRAAEISTDGHFTITMQVPAGSVPATLDTRPGSCAEIMTGAAVPSQADCVIPYEATERMNDSQLRLLQPAAHRSGDCIHPCGSDLAEGAILLSAGARLGSREIAVAASCGYAELQVAKLPSIAIVSTGDELVDVASQLEPHQIRRSNDIAIATSLAREQLPARMRVHIPDDPARSLDQLKKLIAENQIVIISGGISMGKKDFIPDTLNALGLTGHFHGVAQKPGKPMGYWSGPGCAVFALPGNPSSTLTCLHYYVIPAILEAMGLARPERPRRVALDRAVKVRDDLTLFLPVALANENCATPQPTQNSGDLVRILRSDGFVQLPPTEQRTYPAGKTVDFHPWR